MDTTKETILTAFAAWVRQRPGLDPRNYISDYHDTEGRAAYRREVREITRDLHDARELLAYAGRSSYIDGARLTAALDRRLTWDGSTLHYTTGQYWPTEYRAAACRALATAIWYAWRDEHNAIHGECSGAGVAIQKKARQEFSRGVARRWFN